MGAQVGDPGWRDGDGGSQQHIDIVEYLLDGMTARQQLLAGAESIVGGNPRSGLDASERSRLIELWRARDERLVIGIGFGARQRPVGRDFEFVAAKVVPDLSIQPAKYIDCLFDSVGNFRMQIVEEKLPRHADAQICRELVERRYEAGKISAAS